MNLLKKYIKLVIKEDWNPKKTEFPLHSGAQTEMGSYAHLAELEKILSALVRLRNVQNRSSASRFAYANAISRLKQQIKKIKRHLENRENAKLK